MSLTCGLDGPWQRDLSSVAAPPRGGMDPPSFAQLRLADVSLCVEAKPRRVDVVCPWAHVSVLAAPRVQRLFIYATMKGEKCCAEERNALNGGNRQQHLRARSPQRHPHGR